MQDQPEVITLSDSEDEFERISKERKGCRVRKWDNGLIGPKYQKIYANAVEPELSTDIDKIIENTLRGSEKTVLEKNLLPGTKKRKPERNMYKTRNTTRYQTKRSTLNNFPEFWKPKLVTKDRLDFYKMKKYLDKD